MRDLPSGITGRADGVTLTPTWVRCSQRGEMGNGALGGEKSTNRRNREWLPA